MINTSSNSLIYSCHSIAHSFVHSFILHSSHSFILHFRFFPKPSGGGWVFLQGWWQRATGHHDQPEAGRQPKVDGVWSSGDGFARNIALIAVFICGTLIGSD
ncbi:unnamed protein product [Lupinus luteus]|uniref:Uncharacterized protein n=1 Tax=Lupinus luteus TaxID=3873 RepID=A0AAV1WYI2_LUPLU